ncbi:uncharacterized protein [Centruroides vittatus]|uniref:uncharacterized protein n=1 Tax=Centruroides vittatus TaxID=120091 RepID=UPI00350FFBA9
MNYLEILMDDKLSWTQHVHQLRNKVGNLFAWCAKVARRDWGLSGEVLKKMHTGAIIPMVTYGAAAWSHKTTQIHIKRKLISLQRTMLLRITRAYRTVSNDALHVLAGILPMDMEVRKKHDIYYLRTYNMIPAYLTDQFEEVEQITPAMERLNIRDIPVINTTKYVRTRKKRIYTDGSRDSHGTGAAMVYYYINKKQYHQRWRLHKNCNNYQAELLAIHRAVKWITTAKSCDTIYICSDSQSALAALEDFTSKNTTVQDIWRMLLQNNNNNQIVFSWVKAHSGNVGNERADALAKLACQQDTMVSYSKVSQQCIKYHIKLYYLSSWQLLWQSSPKGRCLHSFLPDVHQRICLSHLGIGHFVLAFLTGHGNFGRYLQEYGHLSTDLCSDCGEPEDPDHVLFDCIRLERDRYELKIVCEEENLQWPATKPSIINNARLYSILYRMIIKYNSMKNEHIV